ncbi:MAG: 3'-5' exoribonuclease [Chitinophagaceae bacterium]|nr:3'-5' exoribonuclease [Chitinophagaceae bacterium]
MHIIFLDTEFTGLHQHTTLISIGLAAESGEEFYAELTDFDTNQLSPWLMDNVIDKLLFTENNQPLTSQTEIHIKGNKKEVATALQNWFAQFDEPKIQIWGDVPHWDWVLFCDLFGGAFSIPPNIHYICMDLATYIQAKGLDIEMSRFEYVGLTVDSQHNALADAKAELACYLKLKAI